MLEHQTGDAAAFGLRRCHIPAICNVIAASSLVCTQKIRSNNIGVVLCNKSLVVSPTPKGDSVGLVDVPSNGVGFSGAKDWF
jgi:hypothetical protein